MEILVATEFRLGQRWIKMETNKGDEYETPRCISNLPLQLLSYAGHRYVQWPLEQGNWRLDLIGEYAAESGVEMLLPGSRLI
jgi:hypothetical protein